MDAIFNHGAAAWAAVTAFHLVLAFALLAGLAAYGIILGLALELREARRTIRRLECELYELDWATTDAGRLGMPSPRELNRGIQPQDFTVYFSKEK